MRLGSAANKMAALTTILACLETTSSTFDMTFGHAEYLADHLTRAECDELILLLMGYRGPEDVPRVACLKNIIAWDRSLGRGQSSVSLRIPLKRVGREDLADALDKMVEKEMAFEFENSPFHARKFEPGGAKPLAAGEKEVKGGETLNELIEDYEKEEAEMEKGPVERLTGYKSWRVFVCLVVAISLSAFVYSTILSRLGCVRELRKWIKENGPVYCFGMLPRNADRPHYDPEIHTLHGSFI